MTSPGPRWRSPLAARLTLLLAAAGFGAMFADPKGLGADPVVRVSTGIIGLVGAGWVAFSALMHRIRRS